jgi:hypothetical protein
MVRILTVVCICLLVGRTSLSVCASEDGQGCPSYPEAAVTSQAPKESKDGGKPSKAVRVNGADFEVVAEPVWLRPAEVYGVAGASIALRITNRTDNELAFDMGETLRVSVKSADGGELAGGSVDKRFFPKPIRVPAGKTETVTLPTRMFHTRIRAVCLGLDSGAGWYWLTHDLTPGKYRVSLHYENKQKNNACWLGKVQTEAVDVEVKGGK